MEENVCRFVGETAAPDSLHILNFVLETGHQNVRLMPADYKLCFAVSGSSQISCRGGISQIESGDIFLLLPAVPYTVVGSEDFSYYYISFLGFRGNQLVDKMGITWREFVFPGFGFLQPLWQEGLSCRGEQLALVGESILLYTFSRLLRQSERPEGRVEDSSHRLLQVKKYIDDNLSDSAITLELLSKTFSYNPKYLSAAFRKAFRVGIWEYILSMRINRACALMQQDYTCVKDIAALCGFSDALYFSRVFKKRMGLSPREQISKYRNQ